MHLQCNCKENDKYILRDAFTFKKSVRWLYWSLLCAILYQYNNKLSFRRFNKDTVLQVLDWVYDNTTTDNLNRAKFRLLHSSDGF